MHEYRSKVVVKAIKNLGGENDEELLQFFNETGVPFQVIDDHVFEVRSRASRNLFTKGKWLVVWERDISKVMTDAEFQNTFVSIND